MTNNLQKWGRRAKRMAQALRNAPLVVLTFTVGVSLEAFGWGYIFLTNHERSEILGVSISLALVEAVIVSATGLLALVAGFVAAERRQDPRPEQRAQAWIAQALAVVLILPPMVKAAESFAFPAQVSAAEAFRQSPQHDALLALSRDQTADSMVQLQATADLAKGQVPTRAKLDGTYFAALLWAGFLYGLNLLAASCLWRAKPETAAERERRLAEIEKQRRRADRRRKDLIELARIEAEAAKNRPRWFRGLFQGGRKAA